MKNSNQARSLESVTRRNFLAVGGVGVVGLSLNDARAAAKSNSRAVIQVVMNGGASQLDTFDPKPDAPREIRGSIRAIQTSLPGVHFAEPLSKLAQRAHELVLLRSLHHDAAPNHESGLQLLLTGSLVRKGLRPPNVGHVLSHLLARKQVTEAPIAVRLGGRIEQTGIEAYHGDQSGLLEEEVDTLPTLESLSQSGFEIPKFESLPFRSRKSFGETQLSADLWTAARLVESGVKYVEVNTFPKLAGEVTWDAHGCSQTAPGTIFDYRDKIGPQYDHAMSALFDDLQSSGLWNQTLVVSTGEMGRTPKINDNNGRNHWTNVWSGILAGGGLEGGQVIGASDACAETVQDHPIHVRELSGLICSYLLGENPPSIRVNDNLTWTLPSVKSLLS